MPPASETLAALRLGAQLADMKAIDYRNTLAITALIEVLLHKGLITREELSARAEALDQLPEDAISR